jgi:hypothetical protein
MVVAAIRDDHSWSPARPTDTTGNRWDGVEQRQELGDVVAVAAGQRDRQGYAGGVGEDVVLAPCPTPVNRAWPHLCPPLRARMWAQLTALVSDLDRVLDSYQQDAAAATEDQRLVTVLLHAFPRVDLDDAVRPAPRSSEP